MKEIKVKALTRDKFNKYGSYAILNAPENEPATGPKDANIVFFRDMMTQDLNGAAPSFSTCKVLKRDFIITDAEYHDNTSEVALPLNQDAIIWCAPATAGKEFPVDEVEAMFVPQGCAVMLRPGVWHHAAFATTDEALNVLIVLPERTYNNDCYCIALPEEQQIAIKF